MIRILQYENIKIRKSISLLLCLSILAGTQLAHAQSTELLEELHKLYKLQQQRLEQQNQMLQQQQQHLESIDLRFKKLAQSTLQDIRGTGSKGAGSTQVAQSKATNKQTSGDIQPVGDAHKQRGGAKPTEKEIASISSISQDAQGILTPKGSLIIEPSFKYSHTSSNRVFLEGFGPLVLPSFFSGSD